MFILELPSTPISSYLTYLLVLDFMCEGTDSKNSTEDYRTIWAGITALVASIAIPYHVTFNWRAIEYQAVLWVLGFTEDHDPMFTLQSPDLWFHPVVLLNYLLPIMVIRLYQMKTTRRKVVIAGLLPGLPMFVLQVIFIIPSLWDPTWFFRAFFDVPFPAAIVIIWLLMIVFPPPKMTTEWLHQDTG